MGQRLSHHVCCSARDKNEPRADGWSRRNPQFSCGEVEVEIEAPGFCALSPLWCNEESAITRLALAGGREVQVYRVGDRPAKEGGGPRHTLEFRLTLEPGQRVTAVCFDDDYSSRHLVVAFATRPDRDAGGSCVKIWRCEPSAGSPAATVGAVGEWTAQEGCVASLEGHCSSVLIIVTSLRYLFTADVSGQCCVWQKTQSFPIKQKTTLHHGGIADLAVDKLFCYSAGCEDRQICIWSIPELTAILTLKVEIPQEIISTFESVPCREVATLMPPPRSVGLYDLRRLTALRRPLSRWAGAQITPRAPREPKGMLFVAGDFAPCSEGSDSKAQGVLMEWSLGPLPSCQSALIAHDGPIVALVHGPYDNGPLVTADRAGVFRVWDCVPTLNCSQQVEIGGINSELRGLAMVVHPQHGLYSVVGDKRLFVWRRHAGLDGEPC